MSKKTLILILFLSSVFMLTSCKKETTDEEFFGDEEISTSEEKFGGDFPTLAEDSEFEGTVETRGDLNIQGRFKGSIIADGSIMIEKTGYVECDSIVALDIIVQGYVKGKLKAAGTINVDTTGVVVGATECKHLVVNGGSIFHGPSQMPGYKGETKTR